MNYYYKIKNELINNEVYKKVKDYLVLNVKFIDNI